MTQLEPIYPDRMPEEVKKYFSWFQAAYGWNPFAGIKCLRCGKPISLKDVYRCFDCDASFHKECLINHCKENTTDRLMADELEDSEHVDSMDCWCHPEVIFEAPNGNKVIVHKAPGDELPPADIIAQAIADAMSDAQ